jgi:hypothetical protein
MSILNSSNKATIINKIGEAVNCKVLINNTAMK